MSVSIAQDTVRLALDAAVAQTRTTCEIAVTQEAALHLLDACLSSLGQIIDTFA